MDEEELARTLIDAARESISEEEAEPGHDPGSDADELDVLIQNEAKRVRVEFRTVTDAADRRRLQQWYEQLDHWMGVLHAINTMPDAQEAADLKRTLRGKAIDTIRKRRHSAEAQQRYQQEAEARRRQEKERRSIGAAHRRIRDEIELLLRNYTKANDYKIQSLLDKWRRSGDPSFDHGIVARLEAARKRRGGGYAV